MFVLGVVYDDQDGDQFYDAGEGLSNVSIDVAGVGTTTTATAGGYGLPVGAGTYTVTATQSDGTFAQKSVTLTSKNKKVDFLASEFGTSGTPTPSPSQIIGADAGVTTITVSPTQPLSLVVNLTNAALLTNNLPVFDPTPGSRHVRPDPARNAFGNPCSAMRPFSIKIISSARNLGNPI